MVRIRRRRKEEDKKGEEEKEEEADEASNLINDNSCNKTFVPSTLMRHYR